MYSFLIYAYQFCLITLNNSRFDVFHILHVSVIPKKYIHFSKRKRNKFSWVKEKVTKDFDEAVDMITEQGFKLYDDHDLKCGQKFHFRCGKIPKSRKTWCDKRYTIFLPAHNNDIEILWNQLEHNHNDLLKDQKRIVSNEMTTFIHDFYKEGSTAPAADSLLYSLTLN